MTAVEKNKQLCEKYPFLVIRNCFDDKIVKGFDYTVTELDYMPKGWKKAFGKQMCEEIAQILKKSDYLDKYRILQIKEKYGMLCWYYAGVPSEIYDEHAECIAKYEKLSRHTCIECGAEATQYSTGWISPWCDNCAPEVEDRMVPIKDFLKEWYSEG